MDVAALRDHAKEMLVVIAADLERPQSDRMQDEKARGEQAVAGTQERFLAILSHDLRTPLGAIITSTRFMLDVGELAEPYRTLIARASSSARRMNQMVLD